MSTGGYEVCVIKGDNWQLVRMFDEGQKEQAIAEANHLFKSGEKAVCVIWSKNDSIIYSKAQQGKAVKQNDVMANLKGKRSAKMFEEKKNVKYVPAGATSRPAHSAQPHATPPQAEEPFTLHYLILAAGVGLSILLFPFLAIFGAPAATAAGFTVFGLVVSAVTAYLLYLQNQTAEQTIRPGSKKYKDNMFKAKAALARVFNEGRKSRWSDEANAMVGDTHFGLLLYLIGASKALSALYSLPETELKNEVATMMSGLSLMPASIHRSWELVPEYTAYPRYAAMLQRGDAGGRRLFAAPMGDTGILKALELWEDFDKIAAPDQRVAAVLFTDIVGFTRSQQEFGDEWMKDVVHAHNEIVRGALGSYHGVEVKHTGDGIMASFSLLGNAVRAAIAMHKGIDLFNASMPGRAFHIRVGISTGEPVYMDGDLFGTPVNLAARVLPNAGAREIAVSKEIPEQLQPEGYTFAELPERELKGFEGLHSVFLLKWEEQITPPEGQDPEQHQTQQEADSPSPLPPEIQSA